MTKPSELQAKLFPPRNAVAFVSDVLEHVLDEVAALAVQTQRAEEARQPTHVERGEVQDETNS